MEKTVLITGASRGIGAALAKTFAAEGYNLSLCCHNNTRLLNDHALSLHEQYGIQTLCFTGDVGDYSFAAHMVDETLDKFGHINVLINNAGISEQKLLTDITDSDWENMISTNLSGAFYFCRAALPYFVHRKSGRIINISSMWGETGGSCEVHYSAAKAGLIGLTKALAKEVAPSGITVNAVSPGVINTEMVTKLGKDTVDMLREEIPVMRLGTPEDVANIATFLASDMSSYVSGQVIQVDGGMNM